MRNLLRAIVLIVGGILGILEFPIRALISTKWADKYGSLIWAVTEYLIIKI